VFKSASERGLGLYPPVRTRESTPDANFRAECGLGVAVYLRMWFRDDLGVTVGEMRESMGRALHRQFVSRELQHSEFGAVCGEPEGCQEVFDLWNISCVPVSALNLPAGNCEFVPNRDDPERVLLVMQTLLRKQ
jgi:hypothetical protein